MMCYNKRYFFGAKNTKGEGKKEKEPEVKKEEVETGDAEKETHTGET